MLKNGIDPEKDVNYTLYQGHDKAIIGLLNGQVDAAFVFQDIRYNMLKYYPKIMEQTRVVAFTERIPTDTITVRSDMNPTWRMKVEDAFITLASDPQVWKIFNDVFGHRGYVISTDEKFNIVREAIELMVKKP
ncbi:phosphate/phosphite/phosphonate ABC transporter substrate-binding protein [Paenibacillus sp. LjRoot56]|uniref:phosphate/phosphite/phosphonate ABC transporter substrate-binding protein n=1 Tax=Paenibacillus sp. LjRoot56 TaxID=3342333 RepID=UPI003ECF5D5C